MSVLLSVPQHLGGLHPLETFLVVLLAFGPFVVLAFVVVVMRRRDAEADADITDAGEAHDAGGSSGRGTGH